MLFGCPAESQLTASIWSEGDEVSIVQCWSDSSARTLRTTDASPLVEVGEGQVLVPAGHHLLEGEP